MERTTIEVGATQVRVRDALFFLVVAFFLAGRRFPFATSDYLLYVVGLAGPLIRLLPICNWLENEIVFLTGEHDFLPDPGQQTPYTSIKCKKHKNRSSGLMLLMASRAE